MPHFRTLTEISYELSQRLPGEYAKGPIFFLAQSEKEAAQLKQLCQYWDANFPTETIVSPLFLEEHTITAEQFKQRTLQLKPGKDISISNVAHQLTTMGFERYPRAVAAGSFAVRGNVIDIVDQYGIRLEYDGNTIERVSRFNPSTQISGATLFDVQLYPKAYAKHLPLWEEGQLTFEYVTPKFYHKRFQLLKQDASKFLKVKAATSRPEQLATLLPDAEITTPHIPLEGFTLPKEHFLFLTDGHIFGAEAEIETFANELDVNSLEIGDYIVHIDHGIGLYEGIHTIDGERYVKLRYLGNDKLFVPLEGANRIEKYIGQADPKLTRLSGTQWEAVVHKVQDDVRHTAKELLEMHAKRKNAVATAVTTERTSEEQDVANDVEFALTTDQAQAVEDIISDLSSEQPMDRLLCGDVGFGKTEVALRAAMHVVVHGGQAAILAPTTVLAEQHWHTFRTRLEHYGVKVVCLSRLQSPSELKQHIREAREGKADIIIGTHRLLSSDVVIPKLQLVVIDEEQRFGVLHKERLKALRQNAHVLTMTATPIPRTLNLAMSGLRDISVLNTAPSQRVGVKTIINEFTPELELQAIQEELERKGQVYVVHNDLSTIYSRQVFIQQHFPNTTVAVAHGQLPPNQLIGIMEKFYENEVHILIASTIIENGLDIANANTLIVEHAEDFGLAQLYQLRGRIGRGNQQGYAYLLYHAKQLTKQGQARLRALHNIKELGGGFELAMKDLEIRGVGDILGKKQHGHVQQIGLNLYTRLLHQAVLQLGGEA